MFKRTLTLTTLLSLLVASATVPLNANASSRNTPQSTQEQVKTRVERIIEEASKSAIYDQAGRVTKLTIPVSNREKVSFSFKYDEQNRIQYVIHEDGTQMRLEYDKTGQWQGFSFSDGGSLMFVRDKAGNIIGFKRDVKSVSRYIPRHSGSSNYGPLFLKASVPVFDCASAVNRAQDAVIAAGLVCATTGPGLACIGAVAYAGYLTYLAAKECDALLEEPVS